MADIVIKSTWGGVHQQGFYTAQRHPKILPKHGVESGDVIVPKTQFPQGISLQLVISSNLIVKSQNSEDAFHINVEDIEGGTYKPSD